MKNPLNKRLLRDLRDDLGKYIVIFVLLVLTIGFVSGFLVADNSMILAYKESFSKYNIEDGNFRTQKKMNKAQKKSVESLGIKVYENYYRDTPLTNGSTLRIFAQRTEVNRVCLMEGEFPSAPGEIAVDRMYADNNGLKVGDVIYDAESPLLPPAKWTITGLVALSDYSAMFSDNNDSMFDSLKFGVAVVTPEEFAACSDKSLVYNYSFKYNDPPATEEEENDRAEDLMTDICAEVKLENFIPRCANQAIKFTGEDMGSDRAMMQLLLYMMIAIIAFVFGITITNTIQKEAPVIGTLRAMGCTRGELIRHYMAMPLLVTLISAVIGNILGYTVLKDVCAGMYYASYSLPTYVTVWNTNAFVQTTVVPLVLMAVITYVILRRSLGLSPLKFLRGDLRRRRARRAFPLSAKIPFFARYRMRVIAQNLPNYLMLLVGVMFANVLLLFGLGLPAALDHFQESVENNLISSRQYILQIPMDALDEEHKLRSMFAMMEFSAGTETENETAEKFTAYNLRTPVDGKYKSETIMIYGVDADSRYVQLQTDAEAAQGNGSTDITSGSLARGNADTDAAVAGTGREDNPLHALISASYSQKYDIFPGDVIILQEQYGSERYAFYVDGIYDYSAALTVFTEQKALNRMLDLDEDYFSGYFSETEIEDIDEKYIGSVVDLESLTKVSRQLDISMGSLMYLVDGFSVIIFLVLIYILSKIIIEKNAQSISMAKILGYTSSEIGRLYIRSTTIVYLVEFAATLPVVTVLIKYLFKVMIRMEMTGWIELYVDDSVYRNMILLGVAAYAVIAALEYRKISRVPMQDALKHVE